MKRKQSNITSFFSKKKPEEFQRQTQSDQDYSTARVTEPGCSQDPTDCGTDESELEVPTPLSLRDVAAECDIGKLLQFGRNALHILSRDEMYNILVKEPNPKSLVYPRTRPYNSGAFRQFQPSWLEQFPWLHYSPSCDGVFCRACVFFAPEKVGGNVPGQFVTTPFKTWVKRSQRMTSHSSVEYHLSACAKMNEFLATYKSPSSAISTQLNNQVQQQLKDNQQVVEALLKVVMVLGGPPG